MVVPISERSWGAAQAPRSFVAPRLFTRRPAQHPTDTTVVERVVNTSIFEHDGPIQSVADTLCCGWRREPARGIGVCESARPDGSTRCDHPVRGPGDGSEQARCVAYPWSNGLRPVHCTWWDEDPADQEDASESQMGRVADGMAARVDRLKVLGNGWIPQVACVAFVGLMHRALQGLAKDDA